MGGFQIVGQGLAGSCVGWWLRKLGVEVRFADDRREGAASRVAAGLVNPVTGKNFEPSWRLEEFLPEAVALYRELEKIVGTQLWFPLPVVRLVSEKEWGKVARKLERPEVARWVERVREDAGAWRAEVVLKGGGRLDVRRFCEAVAGVVGGEIGRRTAEPEEPDQVTVRCEGAAGLMAGSLGEHRCAKGEILTVRIPAGDESRVLIGGGGWLVPLGGGLFKSGATYDWEHLDGRPTAGGRAKVEGILARLGVEDYEVVAHEAGVRPIVRRSMPLIGRTPAGEVVFNGLGSKGAVYAPGVGRRLAEWLVEGRQIDRELDVARFLIPEDRRSGMD